MNKKRFITNILFFTMFFASLVVADSMTSYNDTGGENNYFQTGFGIFNSEITEDNIDGFRTLTEGYDIPIISDLDGDGVNEIIIKDEATIRLYHHNSLETNSLEIIDAVSYGSNDFVSNIIAYDIDNDGKIEIIFARESSTGTIEILKYDGSAFMVNSSMLINNSHVNGETMIKCVAEQQCALVYTSCSEIVGGECSGDISANIYITSFNQTNISVNETLLTQVSTGGSEMFCLPKIKEIQYRDYDNDNYNELIFSALYSHGSFDESYYLYFINMTFTTPATFTIDRSFNNDVSGLGVGINCQSNDNGKFITSPLVADLDSSPSNGLETAIAYMVDADEFKIQTYKSVGATHNTAKYQDFPSIADADGELISNLILMDAFPNEDKGTTICTMGYDATDEEIDLLCGSINTNFGLLGFNNIQYFMSVSDLYNVTSVYSQKNTVTHSGEMSSIQYLGENFQEVINSYGVIELAPTNSIISGCWISSNCDMSVIYENPKSNSIVLPVDVDKIGRNDLIVVQPTNVWYIDDGYSNSAGIISSYSINPNPNSVWQLNTTVGISIQVSDVDNDNVGARAILYYNDVNIQDSNWSINSSSGATFPFSFIANTTISNGLIRLMGRDTFNSDTIDIIDIPFTVSTSGIEFGDSILEVVIDADLDGIPDDIEDVDIIGINGSLTPNQQSNLIRNAIAEFDEATNANLGFTIWWYIIMVLVAVSMVTYAVKNAQKNPEIVKVVIPITLIVEIILLFMGKVFGFIGIATILGVMVIILFIGALWAKQVLMPTTGN